MNAPTPKQAEARKRNFRVWQLRGLATQVRMLTGERRDAALAAVDAELALMGAKTTGQHTDEVRAEWERKFA